MCQTPRKYGKPEIKNVGVFQGSAISALLFIIYQDDMMGDYAAINHQAKIPTRKTIQRSPYTGTNRLALEILPQEKKSSSNQPKAQGPKQTQEEGKNKKNTH